MKLEGYSGNTAYTGSTVNLTCKTQDFDVQNIFLKDNLQIYEDREQKHYEYFHMPDRKKNVKIVNLEIKNVTREDAGNYTCLAVHGNGLKRLASFYLKVGKEVLLLANIKHIISMPEFILKLDYLSDSILTSQHDLAIKSEMTYIFIEMDKSSSNINSVLDNLSLV